MSPFCSTPTSFAILILLGVFLCCVPLGPLLGQEVTTISVKINHLTADTLLVEVVPDWLSHRTNMPRSYYFLVKGNKAVTQKIAIKAPAYLSWTYGKEPRRVALLEPGDKVTLTADGKNFGRSLQFGGKGGEKFTYFETHRNRFEHPKSWQEELFPRLGQAPLPVFLSYLDSMQQEQLDVLEVHRTQLTPVFYAIRTAEIQAGTGFYKLAKLRELQGVQKSQLFESIGQTFKVQQSDTVLHSPTYAVFMERLLGPVTSRKCSSWAGNTHR